MTIVRFALSTSLACLALTGCVANMGDGAGRSSANLSFPIVGLTGDVTPMNDGSMLISIKNARGVEEASVLTSAKKLGAVVYAGAKTHGLRYSVELNDPRAIARLAIQAYTGKDPEGAPASASAVQATRSVSALSGCSWDGDFTCFGCWDCHATSDGMGESCQAECLSGW